MRVVLVCVLLAGCADKDYEMLPGQTAVIDYVWRALSARGTAPPIQWFEGPCLPESWTPEECLVGTYVLIDDDYIRVVRRPRFSGTALVHELVHAWRWGTAGDADVEHRGPWFAARGEVDSLNAYLADSGY